MPLNAQITTASYDAVTLRKPNATSFTVQVSNQSVYYQLNVPTFARGDNWMPPEGALLAPGFWNFTATDFSDYGASMAQGIRFKAVSTANPGIVTVS